MSKNGAVLERKQNAAALQSIDLNEHAHGATATLPPYRMRVTIEGVSPILFHRYDCDSVETKGAASKGSAVKKQDDVESYYYRDSEGRVCIPAIGVHGALVASGRWSQDPRSSRKSAMDLVKAGILVDPDLIPCTRDGEFIRAAEFLDKRRVQVNRAGVSRVRPALLAGWRAEFSIVVLTSDLIAPIFARELLIRAGQLVGLCDFRPQYGRFQVVKAEIEGP